MIAPPGTVICRPSREHQSLFSGSSVIALAPTHQAGVAASASNFSSEYTQCEPGAIVAFKGARNSFMIEGEEFYVVSSDDILVILTSDYEADPISITV